MKYKNILVLFHFPTFKNEQTLCAIVMREKFATMYMYHACNFPVALTHLLICTTDLGCQLMGENTSLGIWTRLRVNETVTFYDTTNQTCTSYY